MTVCTISTSAASSITRLSDLRTIQPIAQRNSCPRKTCINNSCDYWFDKHSRHYRYTSLHANMLLWQ